MKKLLQQNKLPASLREIPLLYSPLLQPVPANRFHPEIMFH
ncbi:hypothetical protein ACFQ19_19425 [Oceanobacillus locisalsi]|uniref:Uncharacterized protein n=1 Tax=Oceanobacillus locisalsi TaxID=546107 RepID=A0ABW3NMN4_9BACI